MNADSGERLQKALARLGLASRREAEDWIRAGRLTVNGTPASLGMRVRPTDQIRLDGRLVRQRAPVAAHVFVYHRSPGEKLREPRTDAEGVEATTSVLDRLPKRAGRRFISVSPMPNVDGGLELLSSDGEWALKLQRAVRRLESEFSVRVHGELSEEQRRHIREGVLDRGVLEISALESSGGEAANRWYTVRARGASGKDIRQLFERQGLLVSRVLRTQLGPIELGRLLARGQFRKLTDAELEMLSAAVSGQPAAEGKAEEAVASPQPPAEVRERRGARPPARRAAPSAAQREPPRFKGRGAGRKKSARGQRR